MSSFTIGLFEEFNSVGVQGEKLLSDFNKRHQDFSQLRLKLKPETCSEHVDASMTLKFAILIYY